MSSVAAPSPDPDKDNAADNAIRTVNEHDARDADDIAAPVRLFGEAYAAIYGRVKEIAAGDKRPASPRKWSPLGKKSNTSSSSPMRVAINAVARVATAAALVMAGGDATPNADIAVPPSISHRVSSPTTVTGLDDPPYRANAKEVERSGHDWARS